MTSLSLKDLNKLPVRLASGHRLCAGCAESIIAKQIMMGTEDHIAVSASTGCFEVSTTIFPYTAWNTPYIHTAFGNGAATCAGLETAYNALKKRNKITEEIKFINFAGDGATYDIGLQALSGAMERGHKMMYVCLNNEAYMNTGVQRSSATPPAARTATTQLVGDKPGADWGKGKDVPLIAMAHGIPYVATASVGDLRDLEYKVQKAMSFHGARYIQILVPCPLGWGLSSNSTVTAARMAMETGFYPIYEAEYGKITSVRKIRQVQPVINYLKMQRRYAHLTGKKADPNVLARLQALCDANIKNFGLVEGTDVTGQPVAMQAYERSQAV